MQGIWFIKWHVKMINIRFIGNFFAKTEIESAIWHQSVGFLHERSRSWLVSRTTSTSFKLVRGCEICRSKTLRVHWHFNLPKFGLDRQPRGKTRITTKSRDLSSWATTSWTRILDLFWLDCWHLGVVIMAGATENVPVLPDEVEKGGKNLSKKFDSTHFNQVTAILRNLYTFQKLTVNMV